MIYVQPFGNVVRDPEVITRSNSWLNVIFTVLFGWIIAVVHAILGVILCLTGKNFMKS